MKAHVDPDLCIGCGLCPTLCPAVFQMTDEGVARAVETVPEGSEDDARTAAESCPVEAIRVED